MELQTVKCDKCNAKFNISEKSIKRHMLSKEKKIEETYFFCPKCKHKYVITITDEEIRRTIQDCKAIEQQIIGLINIKKKMLSRAKEKSLELEKEWKQ